jgi:hypothetical protein
LALPLAGKAGKFQLDKVNKPEKKDSATCKPYRLRFQMSSGLTTFFTGNKNITAVAILLARKTKKARPDVLLQPLLQRNQGGPVGAGP